MEKKARQSCHSSVFPYSPKSLDLLDLSEANLTQGRISQALNFSAEFVEGGNWSCWKVIWGDLGMSWHFVSHQGHGHRREPLEINWHYKKLQLHLVFSWVPNPDAEILNQAWETAEPIDSTANACSMQYPGKCAIGLQLDVQISSIHSTKKKEMKLSAPSSVSVGWGLLCSCHYFCYIIFFSLFSLSYHLFLFKITPYLYFFLTALCTFKKRKYWGV